MVHASQSLTLRACERLRLPRLWGVCLSVVVLRSLNYSLASGSALHTVLQKGACLYEVAVVTTSDSSQVFQIGGKLNVIINYLLVEATHFLL